MAESGGSLGDEKYSAVLKIVFPDGNLLSGFPQVSDPESAALQDLAQTLKADLERLYTLAVMPISLIAHALASASLETEATNILNRDLGAGFPKSEAMMAWEKARIARHRSGLKLFALSASYLDKLVAQDEPVLRDMKESLCFALAIWSYTIFESFSTDLWVQALDKYPRPFAANVLNPKAPKHHEAVKQPSVYLSDLARFEFDASGGMGRLLKKAGRVSFESLQKTKIAYEAAFPDPDSDPENPTARAVYEVFSPYLQDVGRLECLRNLIAHRGGRIDARFKEQAKNYGYIETRDEREPYRPTPGEIAGYANAVSGLTRALLAFVDSRIVASK